MQWSLWTTGGTTTHLQALPGTYASADPNQVKYQAGVVWLSACVCVCRWGKGNGLINFYKYLDYNYKPTLTTVKALDMCNSS